MKIVYNRLIPFPGYSAVMLFGVIFARKSARPLSPVTANHEAIHRAQAKEAGGYFVFYLQYLAQWVRRGYRNVPYEREAYANAGDPDYLEIRTPSAWKNYK